MPPFPSKLRQNMDSLRTVVLSITEYSWMKRMELIVVHNLLIGRIPLEKEGVWELNSNSPNTIRRIAL